MCIKWNKLLALLAFCRFDKTLLQNIFKIRIVALLK